MTHAHPRQTSKQKGIVLVVALLILMVMTVIGTSMLSTSTLEELMASNFQADNVTFQAAKSCFKDTINSPTQDPVNLSATLQNVVSNPNVAQNNQCDNPAAPAGNLYGPNFNTLSVAVWNNPVPAGQRAFRVRGFDVEGGTVYTIPITITSTITNANTSTTMTVTGGMVGP